MKHKSFLIMLLALAPWAYGQSRSSLYGNYVTKLQVLNVTAQGVDLEWLSDIDPAVQGAFVIYRNSSNAVASAEYMRDSEVVRPSAFSHRVYRDGLTLYRASVPLPTNGQYYFAVAPSQGLAVDEAIRRNLPYDGAEFNLLPELSYTIQPVAFRLRRAAPSPAPVVNSPSGRILVTSLRLASEEDTFRLTWTAYPNNRSQYVFHVYRSRYPIDGLKVVSLSDLPAYAVVTNKFFFEDQNISFETPYYYAVVAQESLQWDAGLNVFSTPAVLVRAAPPFSMTPQTEYVKQTREFQVQQNSFLTDADIEKAVRQTLDNLRIAPSLRGGESTPQQEAPVFNPAPLGPGDFQNNPQNLIAPGSAAAPQLMLRASLGGLEDQSLLDGFYRNLAAKYNVLVKTEQDLQMAALRAGEGESLRFLNEIKALGEDIAAYRNLEGRLAFSSALDPADFVALVSQYRQKRDQILLKEFTLKNERRALAARSARRAKSLEASLGALQSSYQSSVERLKASHRDALKKYFELRVEEVNAKVAAHNAAVAQYNKNKEAEVRSARLAQRVMGPALVGEQKVLGPVGASVEAPSSVPLPAAEPLPYLDMPRNILARLEEPSFYRLPPLPLVRLQSMDISLETNDIPTIQRVEELSKKREGWLRQKTQFLQTNSAAWQENIRLWKESLPAAINDPQAYEILKSRWERPTPSRQAALSQGSAAFNRNNFAEAAFLLVNAPEDDSALMMLGKSFYNLGAYREAAGVFASALRMGIPEAEAWLLQASEQALKKAKK